MGNAGTDKIRDSTSGNEARCLKIDNVKVRAAMPGVRGDSYPTYPPRGFANPVVGPGNSLDSYTCVCISHASNVDIVLSWREMRAIPSAQLAPAHKTPLIHMGEGGRGPLAGIFGAGAACSPFTAGSDVVRGRSTPVAGRSRSFFDHALSIGPTFSLHSSVNAMSHTGWLPRTGHAKCLAVPGSGRISRC